MNEVADQLVGLVTLFALGLVTAGAVLILDARRSIPRRRASGAAIGLLVAGLVLPVVAVGCWFLFLLSQTS